MVFALAQWYPTLPGSQAVIIHCLGRNEIFFEFDYFVEGGYDRSAKGQLCQFTNPIGKWSCNTALVIGAIVESNLLEGFFTRMVLREMKKSTQNSASMLSRKSFKARKR